MPKPRKPTTTTSPADDALARCPHDGAALEAHGWCPTGQGYPLSRWLRHADGSLGPVARPCPFSCPVCRGDLGWAGDCGRCRAYPGDEYRYDEPDVYAEPPDGTHYRVTRRGSGLVATAAEAAAALATMRALVAAAPVSRAVPQPTAAELAAEAARMGEPEPAWIHEEDA